MATTQSLAPLTGTWQLDPAHTLVEFSGKHMMFTTVKGRFADVRGTLVLDGANPAASHVDVELGAESIDTRNEQRDTHLRSPDFLDVANHPVITFRSTRVTPTGDARATVTGDLTIRGVSRPVDLDVTFQGTGRNPWGKEVAGFEAYTRISRKDFGLTWNVGLETGGVLVSDEIKIELHAEAIRQD